MKAKRLIEVAMPIKEISAESVRDKSIRQGHISTLHLWWARRPLPACRGVVFGSLVQDPLDDNCTPPFKDAIKDILCKGSMYKPYVDIPYTATVDPMEDNLRNRLMMFIGKFSDECQINMKAEKSTAPANQLSNGSLVKWENKNNQELLRIARLLIWISFNSERLPGSTYKELKDSFDGAYERILKAQKSLYSITDRHLEGDKTRKSEAELKEAIEHFQSQMPTVFDPFAGGGAIPIEAARLGCMSYGNDINPVAHIIEKASAEFPQKYAKPICFSLNEFKKIYGNRGLEIVHSGQGIFKESTVDIDNRLAFDIEYYARSIIEKTEKEIGNLYPGDEDGNKAVAYYWVRTATCSNPSCRAKVPMLKTFYLVNTSKKSIYIHPLIKGDQIEFEIRNGHYDERTNRGWNNRGTVTCPCCGSVTDVETVKKESITTGLKARLIAMISDGSKGKVYSIPNENVRKILERKQDISFVPSGNMTRNSNGGDTFPWGFTQWGQLFTNRQLFTLNKFAENLEELRDSFPNSDYYKALTTYLALWLDRIILINTSFCRYNIRRETLEHMYSRQAIAMTSDYPECNPFSGSAGSALNQLSWLLEYVEGEQNNPFPAYFNNASSGERTQFPEKSIAASITDPPYYDAIAYADISDFFYVWLKRVLSPLYPLNFSTPLTPKAEECTALKHHHNGDENAANHHFENKLTQIFDAIEYQTTDIVSIMFAHQSTQAWTTLCNSILEARMNITGSWPIDTEMASRTVALSGGALESSVTVACRPSERKGFGDYKDVKKAILAKVEDEVNALYSLGFRGADLLTACFGQAVSEFGKYKNVEKADGSEVAIAELLDMARTSAFNALLKGVQGDEYTRFYLGWLQMNGMVETDFDDATKFTRVGMQVDVSEIFAQRLLIRNGNKQHLATAAEHLGNTTNQGTHPEDPLIDQVHRAMLAYEKGDRHILLTLLHNVGANDQNAPFWRLVASLKELLPEGKDLKAIEGLMGNSDNLRQESRDVDQHKPEQMTFDFGGDFNNDFK